MTTSGLLAVLLTASGQAQNRLGVLGGVLFSSPHGPGAEGFTSYTGGFGGAAFDYSVSSSLAIRPEVLYVLSGANEETGYHDQLRTNRLEVPVLVKWKSDQFHLYIGPAYVRNLSCKVKTQAWGGNPASEADCSAQDTYSVKLDGLNAIMGLGFDFKVVSVGARYDWGLSNTATTPKGDFKTNTVQIYAGLGFTLGGKK